MEWSIPVFVRKLRRRPTILMLISKPSSDILMVKIVNYWTSKVDCGSLSIRFIWISWKFNVIEFQYISHHIHNNLKIYDIFTIQMSSRHTKIAAANLQQMFPNHVLNFLSIFTLQEKGSKQRSQQIDQQTEMIFNIYKHRCQSKCYLYYKEITENVTIILIYFCVLFWLCIQRNAIS